MSGDMRPTTCPWWRRWWVWASALLLVALLGLLLLPGSPAVRLLRQDTTWHAMTQRGVWRIGMDPSFPPFETLADDGAIVGYDVDLARAMAAQWDMEVELVAIGFDSLIDALIAGKVDSVISALPLDPRLTKDIAYSAPYFEAGLRLAVPQASALAATDPAALEPDAFDPGTLLAGRTVAVEWGSTGDMIGRRLTREGASLTLAQYPTPQRKPWARCCGARPMHSGGQRYPARPKARRSQSWLWARRWKAVPTSSPCRCVPMNCTATSPTRSLPYRRTARLTN
ncbi:MAG: transporter substrate-binding domain-containing protein [Caldilineaceae bacterium]